jgi:alkylhydroperoxidase family enzyme
MRAVPRWRDSDGFDETERTALAWAEAMTALPFAVDDELYAQVRRRFSEQQIVELSAAVAWENFRARLNHALGIESQEFAACPAPWAQRLHA